MRTSNDFLIFGNAIIQGGELLIPGNESLAAGGRLMYLGNFNMTGGKATFGFSPLGSLVGRTPINKTGGTLNAWASIFEQNGTQMSYTLVPYGTAQLATFNDTGMGKTIKVLEFGRLQPHNFDVKLNIISGSTLTIPSGFELNLEKGMSGLNISDYVTNNGKLINNGTIVLPTESTDEEVREALAIIKPTGQGTVMVPTADKPKHYTNSGEPMYSMDALNLTETEAYGDGYDWRVNPEGGFTLTLDNLAVGKGGINLNVEEPVKILLQGKAMAQYLNFDGIDLYNLTIGGKGTLNLSDGINCNATNGGSLTIQDGVNVTAGGYILCDSANGNGGELIVNGRGTTLDVTNLSGIGAKARGFKVSNGAAMTVHSSERGVFASEGGVTVTGGSTLNVFCTYGVYTEGGKLTVDKTSKLITDSTMAPFCLVDKTNTKTESEMVSLSAFPRGTKICSVKNNNFGNSYTCWTVVPVPATEPVDVIDTPLMPYIYGGVKGKVTFAVHKNSSDDTTSGSGSASTTNYIITAKAEKGGTISPDGEVSVSKNEDKTITITANKGYEVKDVLVDGVSVGKVTKYTFEDVTKAHTITASFVETKDEVKEEVKEEKKEENSKAVAFSDVKDGDWFKKAVEYVTEKGLMSGVSEKEFAPNLSTTRGMIVTILWRLEGQPSAKAKASFKDVADGEYYAEAVAWAAENNIVGGYGNGIFAPNDVITREQLASILYRYSKFKGYDTTKGGMAVREFSNYSKLSSWAGEPTAWAVNAGLISGTGNSQLDPQGSATRGQAASILMRYCEEIAK
ncbi:MAG: S-layer homology domain-containing protein [Lachnospiraceae bacterium]|nr:S-layer homology domain-containing protein [Lachnospiraceae bacterium]